MQLDRLRGKELDELFQAILSLQTIEECHQFFYDLCTMNELNTIAQRLEVARMIRDGNTYSVIQEETKASSATISRIKSCLNYGSEGYDLVLRRLEVGEK